jgi:UDP-N-acetylmuramoyl-tripeptide--D-alanyl-D-alanine ligase
MHEDHGTPPKFLNGILRAISRFTVLRYRPGVIGISGSVGKTSAKMAIASVLGTERRVRFGGSGETGLHLAILGGWERGGGIFFWLWAVCAGISRLIAKSKNYPEILVLEYAPQSPGEMRNLLRIAEPNVAVVTAVGDIPAQVELFGGPEEMLAEKTRMLTNLPPGGAAILNFDDEVALGIKGTTCAEVTTFGFLKGADIRIVNFKNKITDGRPDGISFRLDYKGQPLQVEIPGAFGRTQAYAATAAAAVGLIFGVNFINISEALRKYKPAPHRTEFLEGVRGSFIIDDSCSASPLSTEAALQTLKDLPGRRKVAILGDMLQIGKYTIPAHEKIGQIAGKFSDVLVTIGPRAKFVGVGAKKQGFKKLLLEFDSWEEALNSVPELIKRDDLVLVKAPGEKQIKKLLEAIQETAPSSSLA